MESKKGMLLLVLVQCALAVFLISTMQEAPSTALAATEEVSVKLTGLIDDSNKDNENNMFLAYSREKLFKDAFQLDGELGRDCIGFYCLYTSCCSGCKCIKSYNGIPVPPVCEKSCSA